MQPHYPPIDPNTLVRLLRCPACGADDSVTVFVKSGYSFVRCRSCALLYVNPRPDGQALSALYKDAFFTGGVEVAGRVTKNYLEGSASYEARSERALDRMAPLVKTGRLLDAGCGLGFFVKAARKRGWDAEGIDVSAYAVDVCKRQGLRVSKASLESAGYPPAYFDAIVAQDVLEHLFDPRAFVERASVLLAPGGLLVLEMPNNDSLPARTKGARWLEYIPPVHLNFFNRRSITALLKANGFTVKALESELSVSVGFRDLLYRIAGRWPGGIIAGIVDRVDRAVTYFKKDVFYPPVNAVLRAARIEGDLLVVLAVKK
ncbi:MAG: hypothetical protein UX77_C0002G0007 [Parcubacteria group bacterium GW2011_GWA1_47_11]|nr:MAG: hypothetical protein UX77_C0002G0007 [Parcubacteria group bacterium GW2011_GWA1_47_11]